jgi:hypothetical protein
MSTSPERAPHGSTHTLPSERAARRWLGLAMVCLVLAGIFALSVVVGRMPPFDRYLTDASFFKRSLVAHVNLALVAWFYSFLAALLLLLPSRRSPSIPARFSVLLAVAGIALQIAGTVSGAGEPILANYIPTIGNVTFQSGQVLFFAGVLGSFLDPGLLRRGDPTDSLLPPAAQSGLRASAVAFGLAMLTFAISYLRPMPGADPAIAFELLVWGGGHVLQIACVLAMLALWITQIAQATGRAPLSREAARPLFAAMVLPWTIGPLFALQGTASPAYQVGFTQLMQWAIFPGVLVALGLCVRTLARAHREGALPSPMLGDYRISAFVTSALLTLLGFGLGAAIRGSNTMVPAHYHAAVGAITVAFMSGTFMMLRTFRYSLPGRTLPRAAAWQPLLYGAGMLIFASGFALAGAYGMGRKVYGAEQMSRGFAETVGLGMMGIGGFVSIFGGLLFLFLVSAAWWRGAESEEHTQSELEKSSMEVVL